MRSLLIATLLTLVACGDKDDDTGASGSDADAAAECSTMCTDAGFSGGTAEEYAHEVNCFCDGTGGPIDASACTDMCTTLGWSAGEAFSDSACQCS